MIDKIKNLKSSNKVLYYILLPILGILVIAFFAVNFLKDWNFFKAKKELKINKIKQMKKQTS
jgi:hypothetical protein